MMKKFEGMFNIRLDVWWNRIKKVIETGSNIYWTSEDLTLIVKNYFWRFR